MRKQLTSARVYSIHPLLAAAFGLALTFTSSFLLGCGGVSLDELTKGNESEDVNCLLATGQCNKMKPTTCLDLGGQSVEQCLGTGSNPPNTGGGDSTGSDLFNVSGDGGLCSINGKRAICQWDTGCYFVDSGFESKPCVDVISNCSTYGKLFTAVALSVPDRDMHAEENGLQCANIGGTEVAGDFPNGSTPGGDTTNVGNDNLCSMSGKQVFCQWATGCFTIDSDYEGRPCPDLIANCSTYGKLFTGVNPSRLTEANGYGEGLQCANIGGTPVPTTGGNDPAPSNKYCYYGTASDCWPISSALTVESCEGDYGMVVSSCSNVSLQYCDWGQPVLEAGKVDKGCFVIRTAKDLQDCDYGTKRASCPTTYTCPAGTKEADWGWGQFACELL